MSRRGYSAEAWGVLSTLSDRPSLISLTPLASLTGSPRFGAPAGSHTPSLSCRRSASDCPRCLRHVPSYAEGSRYVQQGTRPLRGASASLLDGSFPARSGGTLPPAFSPRQTRHMDRQQAAWDVLHVGYRGRVQVPGACVTRRRIHRHPQDANYRFEFLSAASAGLTRKPWRGAWSRTVDAPAAVSMTTSSPVMLTRLPTSFPDDPESVG